MHLTIRRGEADSRGVKQLDGATEVSLRKPKNLPLNLKKNKTTYKKFY